MINIPHKPVSTVVIVFSLIFIGLNIFAIGFAGGRYTDWEFLVYTAVPVIFICLSIYNFFKTSKILNLILSVIAVLFLIVGLWLE